MTRIHVLGALLCAPTLAALLVPGTAAAASPTPDATVAAAKSSKLYRRTLKRAELPKAGLAKIDAGGGVKMDFARYVKGTALDARPDLRGLSSAKLRGTFVASAPKYSETILELSDRLVVDRELQVTLAPGACAQAKKPKVIDALCVKTHGKKKPPKELAAELASIRKTLAGQPGSKIVSGSVTVAQANKLGDAELLDLMLNEGTRTIRQVSVVPRKASSRTSVTSLRNFSAAQKVAGADLVLAPSGTSAGGAVDSFAGSTKTHGPDYFLTGFTLGQEIDDTWEYTLAEASWWHGHYYVRLDYHLGYGVGLRAPFSVQLKSGGTATKQTVEMKVAPVDVDDKGAPAYAAVGLPANKTFGGKEMVLELKASCHLKVSIPGPDVDKDCPKLDKDFSRDIDPVIGDERSEIDSWWLEGDKIGLGLNVSVASASLDLGLGADVTKGKVGVRVAPTGTGKLSMATGHLWFSSRDPKSFSVTRSSKTSSAGLRLDQPKYGFAVQLRPQVRINVGVDVGVWDKDWTLGPYPIDFLSVSPSFVLGHHDGTVETHDYALFSAPSFPKAQLPKTAGVATDGPKTSPTSPKAPTPKLPGPKGKLLGGPRID